MKTKRAAKKRVVGVIKAKKNVAGKGVSTSNAFVVTQSGKQHGMRKRTPQNIRDSRGSVILGKAASLMMGKLLPYAKKIK